MEATLEQRERAYRHHHRTLAENRFARADGRAARRYCSWWSHWCSQSRASEFRLATNAVTRTSKSARAAALGACKVDILRYFMVENWIITSGGVVLGCLLALYHGGEPELSTADTALAIEYVVAGGIVGLWALGQLAVLIPASRAAAVSPATATRSV